MISSPPIDHNTLYYQDYYLWLEKMAEVLRRRHPEELDWNNLLEEIETLGRSEQKAVKSNLRIVLHHLLKWQYQPEKRSQSWLNSIIEHRQRLQDDFEMSPSLMRYCQEVFESAYIQARKAAAQETGLPLNHFPENCPFTLEETLQENWGISE
jgi:hypothetical protein